MSKRAMKKTIVIMTFVAVLVVTCAFLCTSSLAWFSTVANTEQAIEIEADGVVYISVPVSVDMVKEGENKRILHPAIAMPFALANGAPMDVTKTYAETVGTDNVSYIATAATQGVYKGSFHYSQPEGEASYVQFSLNHYLNHHDEDTQLSIDEIVIDDISFYYQSDSNVRVDALNYDENCVLSANKTSGRIYVSGSQQIYYEVKMHLAHVDELIDSRLGLTDHFFTGVNLSRSSIAATVEPEEPPETNQE